MVGVEGGGGGGEGGGGRVGVGEGAWGSVGDAIGRENSDVRPSGGQIVCYLRNWKQDGKLIRRFGKESSYLLSDMLPLEV